MKKICIVGVGYYWATTLVKELFYEFSGEPLEIRYMDINEETARDCAEWGEAASLAYGREEDAHLYYTDRRKALEGADAVLIAILVGGMQASYLDIAIPEKYGIFATGADTAGPAGWIRSIRNIPAFVDIAKDVSELCPNAIVVNYTNPMSTTTAVLSRLCRNPVVGFCSAFYEIQRLLARLFDLEDFSKISYDIAGMNHFLWVLDFKIDGKSGYPLLRERLVSASLLDLLKKENDSAFDREVNFISAYSIMAELYDAYGYLPYPNGFHICEFLPYVMSNYPALEPYTDIRGGATEWMPEYGLPRQPKENRKNRSAIFKKSFWEELETFKVKKGTYTPRPSREHSANIISAYLYNKPTVLNAVNLMNNGQVQGLPVDICVETMGIADGYGVRAVCANPVPDYLLELMRPQALCTKWIVDGMLNGDPKLLMQALYHDPQCKAMRPQTIREMAEELRCAMQQAGFAVPKF